MKRVVLGKGYLYQCSAWFYISWESSKIQKPWGQRFPGKQVRLVAEVIEEKKKK